MTGRAPQEGARSVSAMLASTGVARTPKVSTAQSGAGVLLIASGQARGRGLVEVKLAKDLRRSLSPAPMNTLWLVTHRALRQVPRIAAVWAFLVEETARRGLAPPPADPA